MIDEVISDLQKLKNPKRATHSSRYFKTGKGEYGEGDIFLGLNTPQIQEIARKYKDLSLPDLQKLLNSKIHEYRMVVIQILVNQYKKADEKNKEIIAHFYLLNCENINNWDLVDVSAPKITGNYFLKTDRKPLYDLARSENLWKKRIAVMSTFAFIRNGEFTDCFKIAEILLNDKHDLIHKAVGWMLREIGKRDQKAEEEFLQKYYKTMPRTMLRYAIEKFDKEKRDYYLHK